MAGSRSSKKPYKELTDLEKITKNWNKIHGLMNRGEWSSAIVRAATATEIAANLVIREELIDGYSLPPDLVDHFLKWANGIQGKFDKLILPLSKGNSHHAKLKQLKLQVEEINLERNAVVHSGEFKSEDKAKKIFTKARAIILELVGIYYDGFELKPV